MPTCSHCSANRYSSIVAAARCSLWLEEQRTTRPVQWTRTSWGVPRIACGMRIENRMSFPTGNALSREKSTPLAEMFRVSAGISPSAVESTTGRASGNRTAQRTSCRPFAVACAPNGSRASAFCSVIRVRPIGMNSVVTVSSFVHLAQGTKVSRLVTAGRPLHGSPQISNCTPPCAFRPRWRLRDLCCHRNPRKPNGKSLFSSRIARIAWSVNATFAYG